MFKIRKEKYSRKLGPQYETNTQNQKTPDSSPKIRNSEINYIKYIKEDIKNEFSQNKNPFCHFNSSRFIECNESAIKAMEDSCNKSTFKTMEQIRNLISDKKLITNKTNKKNNKPQNINYKQTPTANICIMNKLLMKNVKNSSTNSANQLKINPAVQKVKSKAQKLKGSLILDKTKKGIPKQPQKDKNKVIKSNQILPKKGPRITDSNKENNKNILNEKENQQQIEKSVKKSEPINEYEETPKIKPKMNLQNYHNISKRLEEIILQSKSSNIQPIIEITQIDDSAGTSKISSCLKSSKNGSENSSKQSAKEVFEPQENENDLKEESYLFKDLKQELKKISQELEQEQLDINKNQEERKTIRRRSKSERKK